MDPSISNNTGSSAKAHLSHIDLGASSNDLLEERFLRLKEKVLVKRPVLRDILRKRGATTLLEYAKEYVDVNLNPPILQRQSELLSTIHEATAERFGVETADGVVAQLEKYYFVSTADHVGPIVHPFFVNSNLLTALAMKEHGDPDLQYLVVLACANVSLNNSSFPRGLLFNTYAKDTDTLHQRRLSFLPSNAHSSSVYTFRSYTAEEITKVKKSLREMERGKEVDTRIAEQVSSLIDEIYNTPEALSCASYREQVAKTNRLLWQQFFKQSGAKLPELLYLDQEDIVVRLISKYHLTQDTVINHILFDPNYESFINEYFEGIFGSFSRKNASGTYLFWALPKSAKLKQQLWRRGNFLVTEDESYKVELCPEAIRDAMLSRELIPGLLLNFITISFYYGLKCLGGFNQVNYLTLMKNAYIKMNVDLGNYRSIEVCARAQTKEMCDGLTLAFLGYDGGRVALASGLDLILYGNNQSWNKVVTLSKQMNFEEALNPLMPEIYRISYDEKEWEQDLLAVTEKDINQLTGLDRKVQPCIIT
jgi:hypothetical protein